MLLKNGSYSYTLGGRPATTTSEPLMFDLDFRGAEGISSTVSAVYNGSSLFTASPGTSSASASGLPNGTVVTYRIDTSAYTRSMAPVVSGLSSRGSALDAGDGSHVTYSGKVSGNVSIVANPATAKIFSASGYMQPWNWPAYPPYYTRSAHDVNLAVYPALKYYVPNSYTANKQFEVAYDIGYSYSRYTSQATVLMPYRARGFEISGSLDYSSHTSMSAHVSAYVAGPFVNSVTLKPRAGAVLKYHTSFNDNYFSGNSWNSDVNSGISGGSFIEVLSHIVSFRATGETNIVIQSGVWTASGIAP